MKCSEINEWLDMLMDDAISDDMQRELDEHGHICPECAKNIRTTKEMKALFAQMNDEVDVPLPAQAKWRKAIRAEAARGRNRRLYRIVGTVAAAFVLMFGIGWGINSDMFVPKQGGDGNGLILPVETGITGVGAVVVEADGDVAPAVSSTSRAMNPESAPIHEHYMTVDNLDTACGYICDLVAEYEGTTDEQRFEEGGFAKANLYISMPSGNLGDFISAAEHLDISEQQMEELDVSGEETSALLLVLSAE